MFIAGEFPTCDECGSLVLPDGQCVNCGRKETVSRRHLRDAVSAGRRDAARDAQRLTEVDETARKEAVHQRIARVDALQKWFAEHCYAWVRKAVRSGRDAFTIGDEADHRPPGPLSRDTVHELVDAISGLDGFRATFTQEETNMQDSSAPCWVTMYTVHVKWKA